jgi:hypothetical protein
MDYQRKNVKTKSIGVTGYFAIFMVLVYLGVGFWLILSDSNSHWLNRSTRLICGIMFLLYGIFRAYRAYKLIRDERL